MLAQRFRFHGRAGLKYLYRKGQTFRGGVMVLRVTKNPHRNRPRVSVVVSKKVHKSAVGRNRIRRRVYEIIRHELPSYQEDVGYDLAFIILSTEVRTMETLELYRLVRRLGVEAGLYKTST